MRITINLDGHPPGAGVRYAGDPDYIQIEDPAPDPDPEPDPDPNPPPSGDETGVDVGGLTNMRLVATGETSMELRFGSSVAGTARIACTHWSTPIGKSQIDAKNGNFPAPLSHELRNPGDYLALADALFVAADVVVGDNVIAIDNQSNETRPGGVETGVRYAAHWYIQKSGGGETQVFSTNEVVTMPYDMVAHFPAGEVDVTSPTEDTVTLNVIGGPFAGSYEIPISTDPIALADPILAGGSSVGSTLTATPMPVAWPEDATYSTVSGWGRHTRSTVAYRWHRNGVFVNQTSVPTRVADQAGTWTVEVRSLREGDTVSATSNAIGVS